MYVAVPGRNGTLFHCGLLLEAIRCFLRHYHIPLLYQTSPQVVEAYLVSYSRVVQHNAYISTGKK